MDIRRYWSILARWLPLIILFFVLGILAGYAAARRTPGIFQSTATVLVAPGGNLASISYGDVTAADRLAQNYATWLTARPLLEKVIAALRLDQSAESLARQISVESVRNTSMLSIIVENTDPNRAAEIANQLPVIFADNYRQIQETKYLGQASDLNALLTQVQGQIDQTQARLQQQRSVQPSPPQSEIDSLATFLSQEQATYADLVKRKQDLQLAQADAKASLVMVEAAVPGAKPIKPRRSLNMLMGGALGGMLALGVAFLAEYLDAPIKNAQSAQSALGIPTLGLIWRWPGSRRIRRPIMLTQPYSAAADSFEQLARNLPLAGQGRPIRSVLVTSAAPGEGKTAIAANLAVALAQSGRRVTLIDCNFERPTLQEVFGVPNQVGVATALLNAGKPEARAWETALANLCLITSGREAPRAGRMLASERMDNILASLANDADVVILDGPAVSASGNAELLAARVNAVLLVIAAQQTRRSSAQKALDRLVEMDADVVGVVMNDVPRRSALAQVTAALAREDQPLSLPDADPASKTLTGVAQSQPGLRYRGRP